MVTGNTTLPSERWNGLGPEDPDVSVVVREVFVDAWSQVFDQIALAPINDYARVHVSLLPVLAWQRDALAFDPAGTEEQQRQAVADAAGIHLLHGTEQAATLVFRANLTEGTVYYVGDYDASGNPVARVAGQLDIPAGSYSRHTTDPNEEDTLRDARGKPSATPNPSFVWDNLVYHKYVRVEVVLPPGRQNDEEFVQFITDAVQRVLPFTLEVIDITVLIPIRTSYYIHRTPAIYDSFAVRGSKVMVG